MKKKSVFAAVLACGICLVLATASCTQSSLAELVATAGGAVAAVVDLEGDSTQANTLLTLTSAASSAVLAWKPGTPSQEAIEAVNAVSQQLDKTPYLAQYEPFIVLAVATFDQIVTDLGGTPQPGTLAQLPENMSPRTAGLAYASASAGGFPYKLNRHGAYQGTPPKSAKSFKAAWNAIAKTVPKTPVLK
jgi:hypothetical protein